MITISRTAMWRFVPALVCLCALFAPVPALAAEPASYHVVVHDLTTTAAAEGYSGSATVDADFTITSSSQGSGPASGSADLIWSGEQYGGVGSCNPVGSATGTVTVSITITPSSNGALTVSWDNQGYRAPMFKCGDTTTVIPGTELVPLGAAAPRSFTLTAGGGRQAIAGTNVESPQNSTSDDGWIQVTAQVQCNTKQTEVTDVYTPSGATSSLSGLKGSHVGKGQVLTADQDVELDFADGSVLRMEKGSSMQIKDCEEHISVTQHTGKQQFGLILGAIWAKIVEAVGEQEPSWQVTHGGESVAYGNRGTTVWLSNIRGVMKLHVDSGSAWIQRLKGTRLVGKRWIVQAGQTATWTHGAPTIRRGGPSTPPGMRRFR
jgi:hypothetical protein